MKATTRRLTEESSQQHQHVQRISHMQQTMQMQQSIKKPLPRSSMLKHVCCNRRCVIYVFRTTPPAVTLFTHTTLNPGGTGRTYVNVYLLAVHAWSLRTFFRQQSCYEWSEASPIRFYASCRYKCGCACAWILRTVSRKQSGGDWSMAPTMQAPQSTCTHT